MDQSYHLYGLSKSISVRQLLDAQPQCNNLLPLEDEQEYAIEKIVGKRTNRHGKIEYLVKWRGYPDTEDTWEPKVQLVCPELIEKYENPLEDEEEYSIERIIGKRTNRHGKIEYLVKWRGYPDTEDTWEPKANMDCPDLIEEFENHSCCVLL